MDEIEFQAIVRTKGSELYRDMPWRQDTRPYFVLVSELMLQQTQVSRVIPKFEAFVARFPDIQSLAQAPLDDVLKSWSGLGYNRRAKYLHAAARNIVDEHGGVFPSRYEAMVTLPGVGPATAGAIAAYAFNQPVVYIETNVREVYFHHFFKDIHRVGDDELRPIIERTLDHENPRAFYWALMDYGARLKRHTQKSRNSQSRHYKKQSRFAGSLRETRGQIIRQLAESERTLPELEERVESDERFMPALDGLLKDGLIGQDGAVIYLAREHT